MRPHARVHRGRDQRGAPVRERGLGQDVVGEAVRQLGERVRGARCDHEQIGTREMEVDVVPGRAARERAEGLGGYEPFGPRRDERHDVVAVPDEEAAQLAGLVGGDATRHPEKDAGHPRMMPIYEEYSYSSMPWETSSRAMVR
jgi:hypothetical protein